MSRPELRRRKIGPLEAFELPAADDKALTVVLFHGYGADAGDLAPLAQALSAPKGTGFVFPNGHISVPIGPHTEGRGWFPLSLQVLEEKMSGGAAFDFTGITPPGMKRARENALAMIKALGVPWNRLVLGGFSQGAMVAADLILSAPEQPAGLVILSGTLVDASRWQELASARKGLRFFQSHGISDPVLQIQPAEKLEKLLLGAGLNGRLIRFHGGHEIPSEILIQLGAYLRSLKPST
jgi:phospholipase/carboxylesterase